MSEKAPLVERFVRIAAPIEGSTVYAGGVKVGLQKRRGPDAIVTDVRFGR